MTNTNTRKPVLRYVPVPAAPPSEDAFWQHYIVPEGWETQPSSRPSKPKRRASGSIAS